MNKNITLILLAFCLQSLVLAQNAKINVNITDICERQFPHSVNVKLYKNIANNVVLQETKTQNPCTFNNLDPNADYTVEVSSDHIQKANPNVIDLKVMRDHILGINNGNNATILASDFSNNMLMSTLDLVLISRNIIGISNIIVNQWSFLDKSKLSLSNPIGTFTINKAVVNSFNNDEANLDFVAYQLTEVAETVPESCINCPVDSNKVANFYFPKIDLEAGKKYELDFQHYQKIGDYGFQLSMKYQKIQIDSIIAYPESQYKHIASQNQINLLKSTYTIATNKIEKIVKIKFTALENTSSEDVLIINNNFDNLAIYESPSCTKKYTSITIQNIEPCNIIWPSDITIPSCNSTHNTGTPIVDPSCTSFVTINYNDEVFGNPCSVIHRNWTAKNTLTNELINHLQVITIDHNFNPVCKDSLFIMLGDYTINARDLVLYPISTHLYSFDGQNTSDSIMMLSVTDTLDQYSIVYDITDASFCIARMRYGPCLDTMINIHQTVIVQSINFADYLVNGEMFKGNNEICNFPIDSFEIKISQSSNDYTSSLTFDYDQYKDSQIELDLRYKLNGTFIYYGKVVAEFLMSTFQPIVFNCYDDLISEGEPFTIDFYSPNFSNINAFQGGIKVDNASILSVKGKSLNDLIFNQQNKNLSFLWLSQNVESLSLLPTDTIFSLTILPDIEGHVSDFIKLDENVLTSEVVLNDINATKLDLVFNFLQRVSQVKDESWKQSINIYPNPNNGYRLNLSSENIEIYSIKIMDINGRMVFRQNLNTVNQEHIELPSDLLNSLYIVEINTAKGRITKKLFVAK